jgi:hypothetical protein
MEPVLEGPGPLIPTGETHAEAIQNAVQRTALGLMSAESLAVMLTGAGVAQGLRGLANLPRVAKLLKGSPEVAKAVDVASKAAVPATFAGYAGTGAVQSGRAALEAEGPERTARMTEATVSALIAGLAAAGAVKAGKGALEMYPSTELVKPKTRPVEQKLAQELGIEPPAPKATRAAAPQVAERLRGFGQRLAAEQWGKLAEDYAVGKPIPIQIGKKAAAIHTVQDPATKRFWHTIIDKESGNALVGGTAEIVQGWLGQRGVNIPETLMRGEATSALVGEAGEVRVEPAPRGRQALAELRTAAEVRPVESPAEIAPTPAAPPIYPRAVEWSQQQPVFGRKKMAADLGISFKDATQIVEQLEAEGHVVKKEGPHGRVVWSRAKKPTKVEVPAPVEVAPVEEVVEPVEVAPEPVVTAPEAPVVEEPKAEVSEAGIEAAPPTEEIPAPAPIEVLDPRAFSRPPAGPAPGEKQIWEMPRQEFLDSQEYVFDRSEEEWSFMALHRQQVEHALRDRKPVPDAVLADYPDLQKVSQPPPAVSPPKEPVKAKQPWEMTREEFLKAEAEQLTQAQMREEYIEEQVSQKVPFSKIATALGESELSVREAYEALLQDEVADIDPYRPEQRHRSDVERALREKQPVPDAVLADYPDLKPPASVAPAEPEALPDVAASTVKPKRPPSKVDAFAAPAPELPPPHASP